VKNVATAKQVRLDASAWGALLQLHISVQCEHIKVRYKTGDLALEVTSYQASVLTRLRMVAGRISNGVLVYLIALVPKSAIIRALRMDPPKVGEITKNRPTGTKQWPVHLERARSGSLGGFKQQCWRPLSVNK
jgi:hypothetical protein